MTSASTSVPLGLGRVGAGEAVSADAGFSESGRGVPPEVSARETGAAAESALTGDAAVESPAVAAALEVSAATESEAAAVLSWADKPAQKQSEKAVEQIKSFLPIKGILFLWLQYNVLAQLK